MKLTESQLRQVIREELESLFSEGLYDDAMDSVHGLTGGYLGTKKKLTRSQIERQAEAAKLAKERARRDAYRAEVDRKAKMDQDDKDYTAKSKAEHEKYLADTAGERAMSALKNTRERERQNKIADEKRQVDDDAKERRRTRAPTGGSRWGEHTGYEDD